MGYLAGATENYTVKQIAKARYRLCLIRRQISQGRRKFKDENQTLR